MGNDIPKKRLPGRYQRDQDELPLIHAVPSTILLNPIVINDFKLRLGRREYTFTEAIRSIVTSDTQLWVNGKLVFARR